MKIEVRIRVDEPESKSAVNFHYADITIVGDIKAVLNFLQLLEDSFGVDHLR